MKKTFCITICLSLFSTIVLAQTAQWNESNVASAIQAQGFTYRLYVTPAGSPTTNAPVILTSVTCTGVAPTVLCSAPVTVSVVTGTKVELTAADSPTGLESAKGVPFISPAVAPTGLKITP